MFDFLNKLSHNHAPPAQSEQVLFQELSSEEQETHLQRSTSLKGELYVQKKSQPSARKFKTIDKPQPKIPKTIKRGDSIVGKMQIGQRVTLSPAAISILQGAQALSRQGIGQYLTNLVIKRKQERERKVYIREMARDQQEYLQQAGRASQAPSTYLQEGLHFTLFNIVDQISRQIQIADMPIHIRGKKPDPEAERKQEMLRLIKMRESELQDKIGELSVEFKLDEQAQQRALEMLSKEEFNPSSVKTKMAEEFVKEKMRQRQEKKARLEQYRQKRKAIQAQMREEQQQRQQELKKERHQKLVRQFADKQRAKQQEIQRARTEQLNYKQFLKEYKQLKPLYQKKQQQFQNKLKQQKKERYHALKDKQAKYQPLNMELLQMHEERYEQLRREDRERKAAELELAREKQQLLKKQLDEKIYKGKYRYLVLQEMVDAQAKKRQKQAQKQAILMKKQAYSLQVKQHFKPTIDPSKRMQIQQIVNSHKQRHRKFMTPNRVAYSDHYSTISSNHQHPLSQPELDPKKEGEKYHRLFKQYIRSKIERGEVKSDEQPQQKVLVKPPNYLKELRQKYENRIPSKSTRLQRQIQKMKQGQDYRALILKAEQFETKAKLREVKLRNVAHVPSQQAQLQQEYLCAIKAKMQLINNMD